MIPVEPLRKWLGERLEAEGVWDTKLWKAVPDHRAPRSINQIARDWGTSARRLQEILKSRTTLISEINADRLLTGAGSPHLLYVLYSD